MATLAVAPPASIQPSESVRSEAMSASRALATLAGRDRLHVEATADGLPPQTFVLPAAAVSLLTDLLSHLAQGRAVAVMPEEAELTTQQAADMLNVSRPHLVQLIEGGAIPFHRTGTHRRIRLRDLLAYRERRSTESRSALDVLAEQAQDLGLGY